MNYAILRRYFEMATRMSSTLNEVFALVPDSFQQYASQIRMALNEDPPDDLNRDDWLYVEALIGEFPEQVLVECYKSGGGTTYFLYDVAMEDGSIAWSNKREVEVEAALKTKPVMERRMSETVDLPTNPVRDVLDARFVFEGDDKQFASVEIAQKADVKNRNNRIYPLEVMKDAVERFRTRIAASGPMPMETMHRDEHCLGDVFAVIHDIDFNETTGVVSLPKIEIVNTSSGRDILALMEAGLEIQVSQRGIALSHEEIDPNTNLSVTIMDWVEFQGWDAVWNGDASVSDAALALNEGALANGSPETPEPAQQQQQQQGDPPPQQQQQQQQASPAPAQQRTSSYFQRRGASEGANGNGNGGGGNGSPTPAPAQQQQQQAQQQQQQQPDVAPILGKEIMGLVKTAVEQSLNPLKSTLETETKELRQKEFMRVAAEALDEVLDKHPRFDTKQKEAIKSGINLNEAYLRCESLDTASIIAVLTPMLEKEIDQADKLTAKQQVGDWNLPANAGANPLYINNYGGYTYDEVISNAHASGIFEAAQYNAIVEGAIDLMVRNDRENNWVMPMDHPGMKPLAQVMHNYYMSHGVELADETQQGGVGIPVNQVSMLLVPTVWRMTTAFRIAQLHPMTLPAEDIPIERWNGAHAQVNDWERWGALGVGDSVAIPESVLNYDHYRLGAGYQPQHVRITPRARMLARGTVMNPSMRSTALAAREIVNQNDLMLWRALIMEAMKFESVKVTTWTALTRVGSTNEYTIRKGLIPYEYVVTEDNNENVSQSALIRNFPNDAGVSAPTIPQRTLQPLELREGGGDNTTLQYGLDYSVNWVKGTITLTAAGRAKAGTANGVQARYSYATNFTTWDATVPAGSTFVDHLLDLRFKIADARTMIKNRHYEPECLCWNYGLMDKISAGRNFTNDGGNAAQAINMMSEVVRYAGSESIDSTAIPEEYIICSQKMSILFGMHTPFTLTGEHITDNTGDRRYFGEQFSGAGVPAPEKVSIVQVENVP